MHSEPCQTSRMGCFVKIVNGWKLLSIFAKKIHLRCLIGFWIRLDIVRGLGIAYQRLNNNMGRGIVKALQKSNMEFFCKNSGRLEAVNYFRKNLYLMCLTVFWYTFDLWKPADQWDMSQSDVVLKTY